jgi:hypothetical protein
MNKKDLQLLIEAYSKVSENVIADLLDISHHTAHDTDHYHDHDHGHEHGDEGDNCCDDSISMAKTQLLNIMHNVQEMLEVIDELEEFEPWMTGMLSNADCSISKLKEVVLFRE